MTRHAREGGMSLVVAIFLVTVVASLAAFAVTMGSATRDSGNLQLQADRAQAAAHAGSEWGAYRALVANSCAANTPFNLTQAGLAGFRVSVQCTFVQHTEAPLPPYRVYDIVSTAQWGAYGAVNYAYRQVRTRVSNAP